MSSILPVRASFTRRFVSTFADPGNRNLPGDVSRSTACLITNSKSGTRCTSSITTGAPRPPISHEADRISLGRGPSTVVIKCQHSRPMVVLSD
jgi:hypothetical protein